MQHKARGTMNRMLTRMGLLAGYLLLTFPILPLIGAKWGYYFVLGADTAIRAVPLVAAIATDRLLFDGGELDPGFLPLWVGLSGLLLWPLAALACRPGLWAMRPWRRVLTAYSIAWAVATAVAAPWMLTHMHILLG